MTPVAIREAFTNLLEDSEIQPLADAAVSRSEADWLVGINGTRVMTAFNSQEGGFHKTTVGRVQTPTLAILVEREEAIKKFVARDYWEVHAVFQAENGLYKGSGLMSTLASVKMNLNPEQIGFGIMPRLKRFGLNVTGKPGLFLKKASRPEKTVLYSTI